MVFFCAVLSAQDITDVLRFSGEDLLGSILEQAPGKGVERKPFEDINAELLKEPEELELLKTVSQFPSLIENSALDLAPHKVIFFLLEMAGQFHSYYNKHKVITEDVALSEARLCLIGSLQQAFKNGLTFVGLSAPEKM